MTKKQLVPFIIMLCIFLWMKPMDAFACSCVAPPPPEKALENATAVFSGEVVEVIENGKMTKGYGKIVHFKVDKVWKGSTDAEAVITTGFGDGDCGIQFEEGQSYLVYASNSDMYVPNTLSTTICNRTTQIANASGDLYALGEGEQAGAASPNSETDAVKSIFPWRLLVTFLLGLIVIFIVFKFREKNKDARS